MGKIRFVKQKDSMHCGVACVRMLCHYYGIKISERQLSNILRPTTEGVSLLAISDACETLGFQCESKLVTVHELTECVCPCILHWDQNHFVVLYKVGDNENSFVVADPKKGIVKCNRKDIEKHWISSMINCNPCGIAMQLKPTKHLYTDRNNTSEKRSFRFLFRYIKKYRNYFVQIIFGLAFGCLLQLIMPFLTQAIVDIGIKHKDVGLIWLILLGELMIVVGRTATDFIRRWLILHISMRINISLVSDFL